MATVLTAPVISQQIGATLTDSTNPIAVKQCSVGSLIKPTISVGTSSNNVNAAYSAISHVTNGTPVDIDLTSVNDPLGNAVTFAAVRSIQITNGGTTGQTLTVGGGTNALSSDSNTVQAGGTYSIDYPDGGLTVDSTHKVIELAVSAGTSVPVTVSLLGHT